jgi:hypothetical protein
MMLKTVRRVLEPAVGIFVFSAVAVFAACGAPAPGDGDPLQWLAGAAEPEGPPVDIGVIAGAEPCAQSVSIRMDDEDDDNNDSHDATCHRPSEKEPLPEGKTRSSRCLPEGIQSTANTRMTFCRETVTSLPASRFDYAVLRLGATCPTGSLPFARRFDNEDDDNNNSATGNIAPSVVGSNTRLEFCFVRGIPLASSWVDVNRWPQRAVFAGEPPLGLGPQHRFGSFRTDDEDDDNNNAFDFYGAAADTQRRMRGIVNGASNTTLATYLADPSIASPRDRGPEHIMPPSVPLARRDLARRRNTLVQYLVDQTRESPLKVDKDCLLFLPPPFSDPPRCVRPAPPRPLGYFEKHGSTHSFARIAAGLWALQHRSDFARPPAPSFLTDVENWLSEIRVYANTGTENFDHDNRPGDYDMAMKEMISLIYLFADARHPETGEFLLSDNAIFTIINQGLYFRDNVIGDPDGPSWLSLGNDFGSNMRWIIFGNTTPETENHILMSLSSRYLANQWIFENPRNDPRLRERTSPVNGRACIATQNCYSNRDFFKNSAAFEDHLLKVIQRTVYSDMFETNARPYQALSLHALFSLYSYAHSERISQAARNAIDYLAAKFAFQSYEGKRFDPHRRNEQYTNRLGFANDSTIFAWNVLSGAYVWSDKYTPAVDPTTKKFMDRDYFLGNFDLSAARALWTALVADPPGSSPRKYTIPPPIHDFMLNKHEGYWARMQARYTSRHYLMHHHPRYFNADGTIYSGTIPVPNSRFCTEPGVTIQVCPQSQGLVLPPCVPCSEFQWAPEFYFATNGFLNVAGGRHENHHRFTGSIGPFTSTSDAHYDFLSRPHAVLLPGHLRDWAEDGVRERDDSLMNEDTINMSSDRTRWWNANNLGTFKNFTYGYLESVAPPPAPRFAAFNASYPMSIPDAWDSGLYLEDDGVGEFSVGRDDIFVRFYDLNDCSTRVAPKDPAALAACGSFPGFRLVVGRARGQAAGANWITPGFWEIVPNERFDSVKAMKDWVLSHNGPSGPPRANDAPIRWMTTNGDELLLDPLAGRNSFQPIVGITDARGRNIPIADAMSVRATGKDMPLIDVKEVDSDYAFTGRRYAFSRGDGRIQVFNPFVAAQAPDNPDFAPYYCIDSSNIAEPRSFSQGRPCPGQPCETDAQCQPGLKCCYPCGVEGCPTNECMQAEPDGACPVFP